MTHLCIINPMAGQISGQVKRIENEIKSFFSAYPRMDYSIHISRWKRDICGYILRYVNNAADMVRVYAFGGTGTLFEVINGVVGLPNVQVAWYPLGKDNTLLSTFGRNCLNAFQSLRNLSLSPVVSIDTIRMGNRNILCNAIIGIEAVSYMKGSKAADTLKIPKKPCYIAAGFFYTLLKSEIRNYRVEIDSVVVEDDFMGFHITNAVSYAANAGNSEIRINDGYFDLYTIKPIPFGKITAVINDYLRGKYAKWPKYISHYRCKKLKILSSAVIPVSLDGEIYYESELSFQIRTGSLDFVCPMNINSAFLELPPQENGHVSPDKIILPYISLDKEFL